MKLKGNVSIFTTQFEHVQGTAVPSSSLFTLNMKVS